MESQNGQIKQQLVTLFNSMFSKESLRRKVYIFNALNDQMIIPIRIIAKERRVAQITNNHKIILDALKECVLVEVRSNDEVKVLLKGDEVIVRLSKTDNSRILKKQVNYLIRNIKCQYQEEKDFFLMEFQSHAATIQFTARINNENKEYSYEIVQKNPYKCLEEAVNSYRKDKKNQRNTPNSEQSMGANMYYIQEYYSQMAGYYPIFIRKAADSDSQEGEPHHNIKKYEAKGQLVQKEQKADDIPRLNSQQFPSLDNLTVQESQQKAP